MDRRRYGVPREIIVVVLLAGLVSLSVYVYVFGPMESPTTIEVLRNPEMHEGERVEMRGEVLSSEVVDGVLYMGLEKHGRTFEVYYEIKEEEEEWLEDIEEGDTARFLGTVRIASEGRVEGEEMYYRSARRQMTLGVLSFLGVVVIAVVIYIDRETLKEMIVDG